MHKRVLIVGAGIAGHTLGCALAKAGVDFDIIEAKQNWDILGAGMYVQNNALRGFDEIGVADQIVESGWHSATGFSVIADVEGNILARTEVPPCPGSDFPGYVAIGRPTLHDILHSAAENAGVNIRMGMSVREMSQTADAVSVTFSDGSTGSYSLVVGADGINSTTRGAIFDNFTAEYSGFSNWRAILPMHTPREEVVWQMGPEKSFGTIPISHNTLYVGGVSKEPGNPWFDHDDLLQLMKERFGRFGGPARQMLELITESSQIVYTPIHEIIMPLPWSKGRIVLVGDAAHASTPFWAQGASMAVEDAVLLARLIGQGRPIPDLVGEWEKRRHPRCVFVQEGSKNTGLRGHAPGEEAMRQAHDHIRQHAREDVRRRYERLNQPI